MTEGYVKDRSVYARLDNNFAYHKPFGSQPARYELIRAKAKEFAEVLAVSCPESRELSLAMTNLETAVMWANASIARNENEKNGDTE